MRYATEWAYQHPAAQGHLGPHRLQGVRARRRGPICPASGIRQQIRCCWRIQRAKNCRGSSPRDGCALQSLMQDGPSSGLEARVRGARPPERARAGCGDEMRPEVEFHIYRIEGIDRRSSIRCMAWLRPCAESLDDSPRLQPAGRGWYDMAELLRIVQHTAQALACPWHPWKSNWPGARRRLCSTPPDALDGRRQHGVVSQRRATGCFCAGYHATFMRRAAVSRTSCPAAGTCINRWSTCASGANASKRDTPAPGAPLMRNTRSARWVNAIWRFRWRMPGHGGVPHADGHVSSFPP